VDLTMIWANFIELLQLELGVIVARGARAILIVVLAWLALRFGSMLVNSVFDLPTDREPRYLGSRRVRTLQPLVQSLIRYTVYFVGTLMILQTFGVDTASILAAAGIVGLAVGFGAQNLVKDVLAGFFIIFDDHYSVGDFITIAGASGTVERIDLRVTVLRDFSGEVHVIPNGVIEIITNSTRGLMRALIQVPVAYEEDLDFVISVLERVSAEAAKEINSIKEGPMVLGVSEMQASGVTIGVLARTEPLEQWNVERELRKRIKEAFDQEGIEIPYQKVVTIPRPQTGEEEKGVVGDDPSSSP